MIEALLVSTYSDMSKEESLYEEMRDDCFRMAKDNE